MKITVLVTVSRPEFLPLVGENLNKLELGDHECELVLMVDNRMLECDYHSEKFPRIKIKNTGMVPPQRDPTLVRNRIANVRNLSREVVGDTDFVFSFEDDCVIPADALLRLAEHYKQSPDELRGVPDFHNMWGLISGIQVARHGAKIYGAWYADNYQFPTEFTSLGKDDIVTPLVEVDGTGMFCYMTPTHLYKEATYGWREPVGPDVWYGLWLRTKGYVNYVDQSLVIPHKIRDDLELTPDNTEVQKIKFTQDQHGRWNHTTV